MSKNSYDGFFIGWAKKLPKGLNTFLMAVSLFLVGIFAGTAYSFVISQPDPGQGGPAGRQTITGVLKLSPYPVIHVAPNDKFPQGRSIVLSAQTKRGVADRAKGLEGKVVQARGVMLKRGTVDMLQVRGRFREQDNVAPHDVPVTSLGKWRLGGEICDGKCYTGAMRPGTGLAHKACANLCLVGGVPAVFVSAGDVEGNSFFMLSDKDGNLLGDRLYGLTAVLMEAEGEIEKHGQLHVFKLDVDSVKIQ